MKLCYAIPQLDDMSLEELEAYLAELSGLGYKGIEPALGYTENIDTESLKALLLKYGMELVAVRSGGILSKENVRLSSPEPEVRKRAVELLKRQVDMLHSTGGKLVVGGIQGKILPGENREAAEKWITEGFRELGAYAADKDIEILFEPITRYEMNYHNSTLECMGFLDRVNKTLSKKIAIVFDVFHSMMEDASIPAALITAKDMVKHIHLSDTNRCEPGSGSMDYAEIIRVLDALGYDGYLSIEVWPKVSHLQAAQITANYLNTIFEQVELRKQNDAYKY